MASISGAGSPAVRGVRGRKWLRFLRNPLPVIGLLLVLSFVLAALLAPWVAPHDPNAADLRNRLSPPSWLPGGSPEYLLGTDQLGRDVLSRLIHGSRVPLIVGFGSIIVTLVLGVTLGLAASYWRGIVESAIMRVVDTLLAIPNILLYLAAIGVAGPSLGSLILIISLVSWTTFARVVHSEVLSVRKREFVEAASALGAHHFRIILRHILPNVTASIIVVATLNVATIIVLEAALSFLGLGVPAPAVTWGAMLSDGRDYVATAWWMATFPGLCITLLGLGLIFIGDWLRDVLDPRLKA